MELTNPFVYGETVAGRYFTNRTAEKEQLYQNLVSTTNTILISPRRWGKSSLVKEVARLVLEKNKNIKIVYLDMYSVFDEDTFYKRLAEAILNETNNYLEDAIKYILDLLSALKPSIGQRMGDTDVEFSLSFDTKNITNHANDILNLPAKIAESKGIKLIICLDEFQNISQFQNFKSFQATLRSVWQHHRNVGYCLFGSKKSMMEDIFNNKSAPFYHFGDLMYLKKIDESELSDFIYNGFSKTNKQIAFDQAKKIVQLMDRNSHYTQMLAHKVWDITEARVEDKNIQMGVENILIAYSDMYKKEFEDLTRPQISMLAGLAKEENPKIYSKSFMKEYNIGSSAQIVQIRDALIKKEVLDDIEGKLEFNNPGFKIWFTRKLS